MKRSIYASAGLVAATAAGAIAGIAAAAPGPEPTTVSRGRIPTAAFTADGRLDTASVPDLVVVEDHVGREVGFISKDYLTSGWSPNGNEPQPVVAVDGTTLVGHVYPGLGFVRLGERAPDTPTATTAVAPAPFGADD